MARLFCALHPFLHGPGSREGALAGCRLGMAGPISAVTVSVLLVYPKPFCILLAQPLPALGQPASDRPLQGKGGGTVF